MASPAPRPQRPPDGEEKDKEEKEEKEEVEEEKEEKEEKEVEKDGEEVEEEEEEEDTFSCLKSPETSGGCWYGSVPLWHQAANLVSKPLWVCKSTKVRFFFQQKVQKAT